MPSNGESQISLPLAGNGEVAFTLKELKHVACLVETRNFIRAANQAGVSQSALSQSIAALEARIGLVLFNRNRRHVEPSAIAAMIAERGALILNTLSDIGAQVEALRDARDGAVSFGVGVAPAARLLADAMLRFNERYPAVRVHVEVAYNHDLIEKLQHGGIEFCVSIPDVGMVLPGLETESLYDEPFSFICRPDHPLTRLRETGFADVARYPLIGNSEPHARQLFEQALNSARTSLARPADIERNVLSISMQRVELLAPFVARTDYVTMGIVSLFKEWLDDGRLVQLQGADVLPGLQACVVTRKGMELSPASKRMIDIFREVGRDVTRGISRNIGHVKEHQEGKQ